MQKSQNKAIIAVTFISTFSLSFLIWLIYFKEKVFLVENTFVQQLPLLNACLNMACTLALIAGYLFIKQGREKQHIICMKTALFFSALFLISYICYHYYQGDTKFVSHHPIKYLYFFILISHILMSIISLPMVLYTFALAFTKQWDKHRRWAKWTFPTWLYVSSTGVLIFIFLKSFNHMESSL